MIDLLLDQGADVNACSTEGNTALTMANEQGKTAAAAALEKRGGMA